MYIVRLSKREIVGSLSSVYFCGGDCVEEQWLRMGKAAKVHHCREHCALKDSGIRDRYRCMVVGLEEGKERLSQVPPSRKFRKGDIVWIVGEEANLKELMQ